MVRYKEVSHVDDIRCKDVLPKDAMSSTESFHYNFENIMNMYWL